MDMLSMVPAGSTITRVYWRVPDHYGYGDEFDSRDDAVRAAQAKYRDLVATLTERLGAYGTPEGIAETANVQTCIDLCWVVKYPPVGPGGGASGFDGPVERFNDVMKLRTSEEIGTAVPR